MHSEVSEDDREFNTASTALKLARCPLSCDAFFTARGYGHSCLAVIQLAMLCKLDIHIVSDGSVGEKTADKGVNIIS